MGACALPACSWILLGSSAWYTPLQMHYTHYSVSSPVSEIDGRKEGLISENDCDCELVLKSAVRPPQKVDAGAAFLMNDENARGWMKRRLKQTHPR